MPAYTNNNLLRYARALALGGALTALPAHADFAIAMVQSDIADNSVHFSAVVASDLSAAVVEAIDKGIAVEFIIDVLLEEHRRIWWDPDIDTWDLRRRVQYHALAKQYRVQGFGLASEGFETLAQALKYLGTLKDIKLLVSERLQPQGDYRLYLRARLDIESLPAPLRPLAYTSTAWRLNSGWKKWKVGY